MAELLPLALPPLAAKPLVSVLMANYNYGRFIGEAIRSVLEQTYSNLELIVSDDGSQDDSRQVVRRQMTRDRRVRLLAQENAGQAAALNAAYAEARGEVICLLDADDVYLPEKLEAVLEAFRRRPGAGVCHHRIRKMHSDGREFGGAVPVVLAEGFVGPRALRGGGLVAGLPSRHESAASGMAWRRAVADCIFPAPVEIRRLVDAYLSRTAQFLTEVCAVPRVLARQRYHDRNISSAAEYTAASVTRNMEDVKLVVSRVRQFLAARYGEAVANRLRLEDNSIYSSFRVVLYVLTGGASEGGNPAALRAAAQKLEPRRQRWLARLALGLPPETARRLLRLWTGATPREAAVARAGRWLLRI